LEVSVIGSGFASLASACYLASSGAHVSVYEKNAQIGGRARQFLKDGFKFDMGPTWYWMPDVYERFFYDFGRQITDYYTLQRLDPAYRVYFGENDLIDIDGSISSIKDKFESIEPGAAKKLDKFLKLAKRNYKVAMEDLVYKPGLSPLELVQKETILGVGQFFKTIRQYVAQNFKDQRLRTILEFPVLFLGAKPSQTPLFYSFMNHADFGLGTWYPEGGMKSVVDAIVQLATELGVRFELNAPVERILVDDQKSVSGIQVNGQIIPTQKIVSGADYKHSESLLNRNHRAYSENYWDKKVLAPSALLFYVGFSKRLKNVLHHTLFFDTDFDQHAEEIYDTPEWPSAPLFYASFPSITDQSAAPNGSEAGIFLIPLAPDLEDTEVKRKEFFEIIIKRLEKLTGQELRSTILFSESYGIQDFKTDYNSYRGNAYGLANTLMQTAFLRPRIKSKRVKNLYFTGQLTVPGPGVPPALISGKIASELLLKDSNV